MSGSGSGPPGAPTGTTRLAAVIGWPVRHSLSPALLNTAFRAAGLDWVYVALEVAPGDVLAALAGVRALGIGGLSVTMPHKQAVAAAVDERSDEATLLGAVNCVVNRDGTLVGHNTDGQGFLAALAADAGWRPAGARCAVVGAGGAARAIVAALARGGADQVAVVNRTPERATEAAALAGPAGLVVAPEAAGVVLAGADLVVNATSVGMGSSSPTDVPFDPEVLHPGQLVADIVYHPLVTPLLTAAQQQGATTVDGLGMLVHQAAVAFELWTGAEAPVGAMAEVARTAVS